MSGNEHGAGLQIAWKWPGEEPDEVFVGAVRYAPAPKHGQHQEALASFARLVSVIEGRDPYQITTDGGISGDIERVRAALENPEEPRP